MGQKGRPLNHHARKIEKDTGKMIDFFPVSFLLCFCRISPMAHIFLGGGKHQLDTVQLIYLACAGVIVYGDYIGVRISFPQLFDNSFSNDVVGEAAKGLGAHNVIGAAVDQFQHLAC